ncbi:MAG: MaoC/PaaZ C-terminal domain-containing protein [Gammaproteobacteria bacterium]
MLKEQDLSVGQEHVAAVVENLTRTQIVQYAGASGDYNPIHTDEVFATQVAGYPSVFAHGMLTMGLTGKMLTDYVGLANLRSFGVRFTRQVWPGDDLKATATVTGIQQVGQERIVELELNTRNQQDEIVLSGYATARIAS